MPEEQARTFQTLDFHIEYEYLSARDFGALLEACHKLSDRIYRHYTELSGATWAHAPILELVEVHTGESIKFTLTERALPTITSNKDNDIVVGVPKILGIPALIGFLLLSGVSKWIEMRTNYYEGEIKQIELQLRQEEINKIRRGNETEVPGDLEKHAHEIVDLLNNPAYRSVSVNGVQIRRSDAKS